MNPLSPSTPQAGVVSLYQQPQQQLKSESRRTATISNPVEESKEASNEQRQPRPDTDDRIGSLLDAYA